MFTLHPTLQGDTVELAQWPLCRVLLMKDANYPWLILVPQRHNMTELHQLAPTDQIILMQEITKTSQCLEISYNPTKINVAALGNIVTQLHIHVVARFKGDQAWPGPIWGAAPPLPYKESALDETVNNLKAALESALRSK